MKFWITIIVFVALLACSVAPARDIRTLEKSQPANDEIERVYLEADVGVAELSLTTYEGDDIYAADVRYDADNVDVIVEFERSGSSADLFLSSEQIENDFDLDTDDTQWEISLSRNYTWDIELDMGVTEAEIDLSALPVEMLEINHGVSDCRVVFSEPNPTDMRRLAVDAGVGELTISGLGYARTKDMYFDGGTGDFLLDFSGQTDGFRTAQIDVGVGSVTVTLPRDLPVRLEAEAGWLTSVDLPDNHFVEVDDHVHETEGFDGADYGLEIKLDVGIGSVKIDVRD